MTASAPSADTPLAGLRRVLLLACAVFAPALPAQITLVNAFVYNGQVLSDSIQLNPSTFAYFTGGTTFTGPTATFGTSSGIYWQQVGTLSGKNLVMAGGSYLYVSGANNTLTLGATSTATGTVTIYSDGAAGTAFTNEGTITNTTGTGQIYLLSFTNSGAISATGGTLYLGSTSPGYNSTNTATGTVTADGASTTVYIRGNFDNNGTVTAQNSGTLFFDGTNTTANLGSIVLATGGRARLNGTIDNTSATLTAPTGGAFELYGGTIQGGAIASGALTFTNAGGYLDNATLTGDLSLANNTYLRFRNGATFSGSNATFGTSAGLYWEQSGTLTGKTLSLGTGGYIYLSGANRSLTIGSTSSLTGNVLIYPDGSVGSSFTNQGTLTHTLASSNGQIYANTFTNEGSITATAGALFLGHPSAGYNSTNAPTGTVTADGASTTVYIRGNFDNNGTLTAQNSGTLLFDGTNTTANLGNVVLSSGGRARLNGTIDNASATLTAPTGGTFELYGGTIQGGTIATGALTFTGWGGYLDNAILTGDLSLANNAYVRFRNGATFSGSNATFGASAGLYWEQSGTLTGKTLSLGTGGYIYLSGLNRSLTIASTSSVTGNVLIYPDGNVGSSITNQGTLTHSNASSSGQVYAFNFTNEGSITATAGTLLLGHPTVGYNSTNTPTGTVTADGASTTVYLRGNFDNNGTVTAQNSGTLLYDGTNTTANLGNIVLATGGRARLNGTIDNTSATLTAPTGGSFELYGGTIQGGTIASGALTFTGWGGNLDNATLTGDLSLASSAYLRFRNGATFSGPNATLGSSSSLQWEQSGTLTGKALSLGTGAYVYLIGASRNLTIGSTSSVSGNVSIYSDGSAGTSITNQGTLTHTNASSGYVYAPNFTNEGSITATVGTLFLGYPSAGYNSTNAATGTVTANGATIYLRGNFDNNGTVTAQNSGTLLYDGTNTTANLGNIVLATGGRARLNGTIDNTSATLNAPTGGAFELYGGTIQGGTIASGALTFSSSGGYLDATTFTGDLNLANNAYVRFRNGATFDGSNATFGTNSGLYWEQSGTLTGKAFSFGSGSYVYLAGANRNLTIAANSSISGGISIYGDGSLGSSVVNQGTLTHTVGGGSLYARNWTNEGTIAVNSGYIYLGTTSTGYVFTNTASGTLLLNGGLVYLYAPTANPFVNEGIVALQSGTLYAYTTLFNGTSGTIRGAGTIDGDVTLQGGVLSPGNSIGTLTLANSDFAVTGTSTLQIELSGVSSDRLTFQNPTSPVALGAGLLDLSLLLLGAPAQGTTYTIANITSGSNSFTGYFNNLPNSGDAFIASFGGTDYTFQVTYLANSINLTAVPEPGTYALFALGLGFLWLMRRRRA